jgi:integrase
MARSHAQDPRLQQDPPSYEGPRVNRDGSVSYYHRYRLSGVPHVETIRSDAGAVDPAANARAKAWTDYDDYLAEKEADGLDDRRDRRQNARQLIRLKLAEWYAAGSTQWDTTTRSNYATQMDLRIDPYWGDRPVASAGRKKNITDFRNWLMDPMNGYGSTYKLPTVKATMSVLSAFCTWLVSEDESIELNHCLTVKVVDGDYIPDPQRKREPMTPVQIERVSLAFGQLTRKVGGGRGRKGVEQPLPEREIWMHRVVLYLLAWVGIRPEDISLARWADLIDEDSGEFRSHMTVQRAKTRAGTKPRELFEPVVDVLRVYYRLCGSPTDLDTPLIVGPRGGPFNRHNWLADVWKTAFALSGIKPYRVPYAARHSAASSLAIAGWDPGSVTDHLGHSSTASTARYRHQFADAAKRRHVPAATQIREARIEVFGYDFGDELAVRRARTSL